MKITLSEQENALEETVMEHLQRLMLRYNESQREKSLDLKWFLSHNFLFRQMALTDLGFAQKMIDEYSFLLISREGL